MSYFPVNRDQSIAANPVATAPLADTALLKSRKLRIALLGYRSHPHVGGQGIYLQYLSKALVELGHSVDVISGPPYPELDPRVRLIQLPSLDLYAHPNPTRALKLKHCLSLADFYEWWSKLSGAFGEPYSFGRRLYAHFKKHKPHYDIVHDNQSLCYGLLDLQKRGVNVIATVHHPITQDRDLALAIALRRGRLARLGIYDLGEVRVFEDRQRARTRRRADSLEDAAEPVDESLGAYATLLERDRMAALDAALALLPDRQRQAVVLRHLEGLSNPDIATIMEIGVEAVESLTARGKRALAAALAGQRAELGYEDEGVSP